MSKRANIFIAGAGGIGRATGLILAEFNSIMDCKVTLGDISERALADSKKWIEEGCTHAVEVETVVMSKTGEDGNLSPILQKTDVILDCLPGSQAPRMARLAINNICHYANLTEYVAETNEIMKMAENAETGFVLQTGLAPGFINILACELYGQFKDRHHSDKLDDMTMKVGAITPHGSAPHYYAFTWSPIGVATEYLKDAVVVKDYETTTIPALSGRERIFINGKEYEDNYTSGGAADLPEAFAGKIKDLSYKTIRIPGHYAWVNEVLAEIPINEDRIAKLERTMLDHVPAVEDDLVVIYASVTGKDDKGQLKKIEKAYEVYPTQIGNKTLRAIQSTTAAPLCEMAYMLMQNQWKGVVLQSQIDPSSFMAGPYVNQVYG